MTLRTVVRTAVAIVAGAAAHVEGTALAENVFRPLLRGSRPWPPYAFVGTVSTWSSWTGLVLGLGVAVAIAWPVLTVDGDDAAPRRRLRPMIVAAAVAAGAAALLILSAVRLGDWHQVLHWMTALLVGAVVAPFPLAWSLLRDQQPTRWPVAAVLVTSVLCAIPAAMLTWEAHTRVLPPFKIELVAAYHAGKEPRGRTDLEHVQANGLQLELDRSDELTFTDADVDWVHWTTFRQAGVLESGVILRLRDTASRALEARSRRRYGNVDALLLNGRLVDAPVYEDVLARPEMMLSRFSDTRRTFEELTGRPAPVTNE